MKRLRQVRNNIFSVVLVQIVSLFFSLFTFGIVARILTVPDFGKFNYLLALFGFSAKLIDFGINPIVLRETSKRKNFNEYISSTFILKTLLIILLLIVVNIYSFVDNNSFTEKILLNLFVLNIFLSNKYTNIRELLIVPYKVNLRMSIPMGLVLLDSVLLFLLTLTLKNSQHTLLSFVSIYVLSNVPSTIILFLLLKRKEKIIFIFDKKLLKNIIKLALPIYGYTVLTVFYKQIDIVMLGITNGSESVALYSSALRLSTPLMILASATTVTFFPIIVKKIKESKEINSIVSLILKTLIVLATSIGLFLFFHATEIIKIIFGTKYIASSIPLKFLAIALVFSFINYFSIDLLTALNKQKTSFYYAVLLTVLAVPLYVYILPKYSYIGASLVRLFTMAVGSIFLYRNVVKKVNIKLNLIRIIIWMILNIVFFTILKDFNLYLLTIIESIFLIVSLFRSKIFNSNELLLIFSTVLNKKYIYKINVLLKK